MRHGLSQPMASIEARIRGLVAAAHLHAALLQVRDSDTYRRGGYLGMQALDVLKSIIAVQRFASSRCYSSNGNVYWRAKRLVRRGRRYTRCETREEPCRSCFSGGIGNA